MGTSLSMKRGTNLGTSMVKMRLKGQDSARNDFQVRDKMDLIGRPMSPSESPFAFMRSSHTDMVFKQLVDNLTAFNNIIDN